MTRLLTFTQKSRDLSELENIHTDIIGKIDSIETLKIKYHNVKTWNLGNGEQLFERTYWIDKQGRKLTWNDVYRIINSVKAVPYSFEKGKILDDTLVMSL